MCNKCESNELRKDFVWKYVKEVDGEKYMRCMFCDQVRNGGVNRLKHHLTRIHHGMRPCSNINEDVRLQCRKNLSYFYDK